MVAVLLGGPSAAARRARALCASGLFAVCAWPPWCGVRRALPPVRSGCDCRGIARALCGLVHIAMHIGAHIGDDLFVAIVTSWTATTTHGAWRSPNAARRHVETTFQ